MNNLKHSFEKGSKGGSLPLATTFCKQKFSATPSPRGATPKTPNALKNIFIALLFCCTALFAAGENAPWLKGERLTYSIGWGFVNAGVATMEVKPIAGDKTEFYSYAHDTDTFKKIFPVSDTVYTRVRNKGLSTEVFRKSIHEGSYHNKSVIRFDRVGTKAWLSDTVFTDPIKREIKRAADTAVTIKGDEHSIISAFYMVRSLPLTVGETAKFSAVSGKKRYELKVVVHGKEVLDTKIGKVSTIKVEPMLDGDGIFNSKGRIFVWFTDDERRIPVLMECEIALGSVKAKLIKVEK